MLNSVNPQSGAQKVGRRNFATGYVVAPGESLSAAPMPVQAVALQRAHPTGDS